MTGRPIDAALLFVSAVNHHDVDALASLMTADHVFENSEGTAVRGREKMREAWQRYFAMFPDYAIKIRRVFESGPSVALFGSARGTWRPDGVVRSEASWEIPAAWEAEIRGGRVAVWRVYADSAAIHRILSGS